jgi:pimeloyl-ACP methyl ester carboxylesterase
MMTAPTKERSMTEAPDTVVLIHGLWMTSRSWELWSQRYRDRGLTVIAEGWPGMDADVETLRRDSAPIAALTMAKVVDHYDAIVRGLDRPPIIIGHSFGGAFTQVLLDRGLGAAGVAIASAAVKGVTKLPFSTLRTGWPILRNPANKRRAVSISAKQFHYRFANHLTLEESMPLYERYCVPGAGHVLFEGATANFHKSAVTRIDFDNDRRCPLLFIAGGLDHVSPPSINRSNAHKYRRPSAITEYKEFAGRSHLTICQEGWEAVADYALDWAIAQSLAPRGSEHHSAGHDQAIETGDPSWS